jgi:hypothetical protein
MTKKMSDNSFEIDSGISQSNHGSGGQPMYPWEDMKSGDSFFVSTHAGDHRRIANTVYNCGRVWLERRGLDGQFRVSQRQVKEGGLRGVRVWMLDRSEPNHSLFGAS